MNDNGHVHSYGTWTDWIFYGSGQDIRERFCKECPHGDDQTRPHSHSYGPPFEDPYAPIGSGLQIRVCAACDDVARA